MPAVVHAFVPAVVHALVAHILMVAVTLRVHLAVVVRNLRLSRPCLGVHPVIRGVEQERCGGIEGAAHSCGRGDVGAHPWAGHLLPQALHEFA